MLASEMIKLLEELIKERGDKEVEFGDYAQIDMIEYDPETDSFYVE